MSMQTRPFITPEEYLERERTAAFRSDYYNALLRVGFRLGFGSFLEGLLAARA